jgi:NAD(P)H-dependent nitrite reductase small subunit
MEDVPCSDLPAVLAGLVRHGAFKTMRQQLWKMSQSSVEAAAPAEIKEPARPVIRPEEIPENSAKMIRVKGNEMAVFKRDGQVYAIQNICPHEGGQLSKGWLEGDEVVCPLHGYKFHLKTGLCSTDPALKAKVFKLVPHGDHLTLEE